MLGEDNADRSISSPVLTDKRVIDQRCPMTPTERGNACIRLLAEIDQLIAECEDLADQRVAPVVPTVAAKR
jgi:hypothetical protein